MTESNVHRWHVKRVRCGSMGRFRGISILAYVLGSGAFSARHDRLQRCSLCQAKVTISHARQAVAASEGAAACDATRAMFELCVCVGVAVAQMTNPPSASGYTEESGVAFKYTYIIVIIIFISFSEERIESHSFILRGRK